MNAVTRAMTKFFSKSSNFDLDLTYNAEMRICPRCCHTKQFFAVTSKLVITKSARAMKK